MDRSRIPQRLFAALDKKNVGVFLRFWSALPPTGREFHPLSFFVWAAINELGEQRMRGEEHFASDQREQKLLLSRAAESAA